MSFYYEIVSNSLRTRLISIEGLSGRPFTTKSTDNIYRNVIHIEVDSLANLQLHEEGRIDHKNEDDFFEYLINLVGSNDRICLEVSFQGRLLRSFKTKRNTYELILYGSLSQEIESETLRILERWALDPRSEYSQWKGLNYVDMEKWQIALFYNEQSHTRGFDIGQMSEPGFWDQRRREGTGGSFVMECKHVTCIPSFFIALGEALLGPGRIHARCLTELERALKLHEYYPFAPFSLTMLNHQCAKATLTAEASLHSALYWAQEEQIHKVVNRFERGEMRPFWDAAMQTMEAAGVDVVLA